MQGVIRMMDKKCFTFLTLLIFTLMSVCPAQAQKDVVLVTDPDIQTIFIGSGPGMVNITAWSDRENLRFSWQIKGPGTLSGDMKGANISYIPPDKIAKASAQVLITADAINDNGEETTGRVTFTLLSPPPSGQLRIISDVPDTNIYVTDKLEGMAHPGKPLALDTVPTGHLIVRAEAEGHPVKSQVAEVRAGQLAEIVFELITPEQRLEQLMKKGDAFFDERIFAEPKGNNAFETYREVLTTSPRNSHALNRIQEMINICMSLGDDAYQQQQYKEAKIFYRECLPIMRYAIDELNEKAVSEKYRKGKERLEALEKGVQIVQAPNKKDASEDQLKDQGSEEVTAPEVPMLSEEKEVSPESPEMPESEIGQMLKKADVFFDERHFVMPHNENAFNLYQAVLKADPGNIHAREKIREMMKIYEAWGKTAEKQKNYSRAKIFYQRYLTIGDYVTGVMGDQSATPDIRKIQNRLGKIKKTSRTIVSMLKKGDDFFRQQQFTDPEGNNAFEMYKKILKTDRNNSYARKKIFEMAKIIERQADKAYQQRLYREAEYSYQAYLDISEYIFNASGKSAINSDIWKIQNRLHEVEHNIVVEEHLRPIEEKLSGDFLKYKELRKVETQGEPVSDKLIQLLKSMVETLRKTEDIYGRFSRRNTVILEKTEQLITTRKELEKEISARMNN